MQHMANGKSKIVRTCDLPLTSTRPIDLLVTDLAVFEVTQSGLMVMEIAPDVTVGDVEASTEARFEVCGDLKCMDEIRPAIAEVQ